MMYKLLMGNSGPMTLNDFTGLLKAEPGQLTYEGIGGHRGQFLTL